MNKQQLARKIWESANKMRSKIEAHEYKDFILGFIFYKYLSDKEERYLQTKGLERRDFASYLTEDEEANDTYKACQNNLGYFIAYDHLFSTWLAQGAAFSVAEVRDALSAFNRNFKKGYAKLFDKIFETLHTGLSKLGENTQKQTKAIRELIELIKDIPTDSTQEFDVLGFVYEYLIGHFAANAGKKAGEFYTPHEVSLLMSQIAAYHLRRKSEIKIYDPTSGSGSLLLNIGRAVSQQQGHSGSIRYYAQELKENTFNLTRMNLVMHGISPDNISVRCSDTLEEDWPLNDSNGAPCDPLRVDAVVSNPPYSQTWNPEHKESDPRYKGFGLAPKTKADYAFLLHDLYHVKHDGIMAIVLPHGVLFRGGSEEEIRRNLLESDHIDAIIGLPPNIFFGTGIPTIIMILKRSRSTPNLLFIDASKGFAKEGKSNRLRASDIRRILDCYKAREDVEGYARGVSRNEIRDNGYNLNIPRYVAAPATEVWDSYALMFGGIPRTELKAFEPYWEAFPSLFPALFQPLEGLPTPQSPAPYLSLRTQVLREAIESNADAKDFAATVAAAFNEFPHYLHQVLIAPITVQATEENSTTIYGIKEAITEELFTCLAPLPLLDRYHAYQLFDDHWQTVGTDLEVIRTEGYEVVRVVDPNMVLKKKNGIEVEVQEGYVGRIMPFALVQATYLKEQTDALQTENQRLLAIEEELPALVERLEPDERESASYLNDEGDNFVQTALNEQIKALDKRTRWSADSREAIWLAAQQRFQESKDCKKRIKSQTAALESNTKHLIETLSEEQVEALLTAKWITALLEQLLAMPQALLAQFAGQLKALAEKYAHPLTEIEQEIKTAEQELTAMLDDLEGDAYDRASLDALKALLENA